jgi:integrase
MRTTNSVTTIEQRSFTGQYSRKMRNRRRLSRQQTIHSECLSPGEVERLVKAAQYNGRFGYRDSTLILLAYGHGFRVSELINLKWAHIDFGARTVRVSRLKNGVETVHPLTGREYNSLQYLQSRSNGSDYVFVSGHKGPLSTSIVNKLLKRAGEEAGLRNPVQPYMLHLARGFDLARASSQVVTTRH